MVHQPKASQVSIHKEAAAEAADHRKPAPSGPGPTPQSPRPIQKIRPPHASSLRQCPGSGGVLARRCAGDHEEPGPHLREPALLQGVPEASLRLQGHNHGALRRALEEDEKHILVLQLLSNKRVQNARFIRDEETALFVKRIHESAGKPVNITDMFTALSNDAICRSAFGRKYSESENGKKFLLTVSDFMGLLGSLGIGEFIPWLSWIGRINGFDKKINKAANDMNDFFESVIEERIQSLKGQDVQEKKGDNFLDLMLEIYNGSNKELSIERDDLKPLVLDIIVGGTDTISTTLDWTMVELLRHPTVMEKLQREVRGIVGDKEEITEDDLEKMHYMKAVIKESLRYHPPVTLIAPRQARKDAQVFGYDVAAGIVVMVSPWARSRDPCWVEPEKFNPERFLNSSIDYYGLDFEFIPFGAGRRRCPGIAFAAVTIELLLANLMQKFDWKLPDGVQGKDLDMREFPGLTVHRVVPLLVVATPSK